MMAAAYHSGDNCIWTQKPMIQQERLTAQHILVSSMKKLDEGRKSRVGIRLQRGLMIAITALKARQVLWQPLTNTAPQQHSHLPVPQPEQYNKNPLVASVTTQDDSPEDVPIWPSVQLECNEDINRQEDLANPFDFNSQEPIFPDPLLYEFQDNICNGFDASYVHPNSSLGKIMFILMFSCFCLQMHD